MNVQMPDGSRLSISSRRRYVIGLRFDDHRPHVAARSDSRTTIDGHARRLRRIHPDALMALYDTTTGDRI